MQSMNKRKYKKIRNLTVRIDDEMLDKLHIISDYEGRSANSQVLILIRNLIGEYESKYGDINCNKKSLCINKRISLLSAENKEE